MPTVVFKVGDDVSTDVIYPGRYMATVLPTETPQFAFADETAFNAKLKSKQVASGNILVGGKNFGCGSSREHAPWALMDAGILVVIAPSFADIFHSNSAINGLLTVALPQAKMDELFAKVAASPKYELTVNVETLTVSDDSGWSAKFPLDAFRQHCLLNGLDQIGITEKKEQFIKDYEARPALY